MNKFQIITILTLALLVAPSAAGQSTESSDEGFFSGIKNFFQGLNSFWANLKGDMNLYNNSITNIQRIEGFFTDECGPGTAVESIESDGSFECTSFIADYRNEFVDQNGDILEGSLNMNGYNITGIDTLTGESPIKLGDNISMQGYSIDGLQTLTASNKITVAQVDSTNDNVEIVTGVSDLPSPENGVIQLENNTVYYFKDIVAAPYTLQLGEASPLIGSHGASSGYIHTGGSTALTTPSFDAGFFMRDFYMHSPGGTLFNLSASSTTEMLVESTSFSDAAGLGDIANLGEINGYRVPTFKSANFEDFSSGLTFTGTSDKVFITNTPFRDVDNSGVTIVTFDSNYNVDIVDMANNYIKNVEPDTEFVRVETGALPSSIFQFRGTTADPTVTKDNILTGEVGTLKVGTKVSDSYPIKDSDVGGVVQGNTSTVVTGSGTSLTQIEMPTRLLRPERVSMPANSTLQYEGKFDAQAQVLVTVTVTGVTSDEIIVKLGEDGNTTDRAVARGSTFNSNSYSTITLGDDFEFTKNDRVRVYVENRDGTGDVTVTDLSIVT